MQLEENSQVNQLRNLKIKLGSREMSTLIGAGFSKNVSDFFPTWWELLYDIVVFLYGSDIEEDFEKLKNPMIIKAEYFDSKIESYINKIGYLEIVSLYIKQKGYREAITTYIEQKTPKVQFDGNKRYLVKNISGKTNKIELTDELLSLHKTLINLPWNNIYTTNYDEMLEVASDLSTEESLSKIKIGLDEELMQLQNEKHKFFKNKNILADKLIELEDQKNNLIKVKSDSEEDSIYHSGTSSTTELRAVNNEILKLNWDIDHNERRSKYIEKELSDIQKAFSECINVVKNSSQLSIKRNKNIIKLHGTLRDDNYGFDNDPRLQYIIAKEDYETYPQKHEAFTQLMRISLLQESYCLVGFSGVDPNFIEWVKWVRDILEKGNHENNDYKIYLIEAGETETPDDLKLFYENYRIYKISLENAEVISFLESNTNILVKNRKNKKELLQLFVNYLGSGNHPFSKIFLEKRNKTKYQEVWNKFNFFPSDKIELNNLLSNYEEIIDLKNIIKLPNLEFAYSRNKTAFLHRVLDLLSEVNDEESKQEKLLNLTYIAIDDLDVPLSLIWENDEILLFEKISRKFKGMEIKFNNFLLKDSLLRLDNDFLNSKLKEERIVSDELIHQRLIYLLLNFNFKDLNTEVEKWNPISPLHIIRKAGILSFYNLNHAERLLSDNWNKFQEISIEEQLHYYQILKYFSTQKSSKDLNEKIINIKSLGFGDLYNRFENLLQELKEKPQKLDRYGANRFSISNSIDFSNDSSALVKGVQFVQMLFNFCLPITTPRSYLFNVHDWYIVYKAIFQSYPYPAVFFTLQYTDQKLIRRMAQDFINSDYLIEETNYLLPKLLAVYENSDTIPIFKKSILLFCTELFVAVDPELWESHIFKIFKNKSFQKYLLDSKRDENYILITGAIPFIKDPVIIRNIIDFCLNNRDNDLAISILYNLNENKTFKKLKTKNINAKLRTKITTVITELINNENLWFIVGNIFYTLSKSQLQLIKKQLIHMDYYNVKNVRLWNLFVIFSEGDKNILKFIKKGIIQNNELWNAGILASGSIYMGHEFIMLHSLKNDKFNLWTKSEVLIIYNKMVAELIKIEDIISKKGRRNNFDYILQEMIYFLSEEKNKLHGEKDYESVNKRIIGLYEKDLNVIDNIISNDSNKIIWGLSELSYKIDKKNSIVEKKKMISALINKIIFGNSVAIEASLICLVSYLKNENLKKLFSNDFSEIIIILNIYSKSLPENTEKTFMMKNMIEIAENLDKYSVTNEIIDYWKNIKESKRYNF